MDSFLPVIKGVFWKNSDWTIIKIEIKLIKYTIVIATFLLGALFIVFVDLTVRGIFASSGLLRQNFLRGSIFLFGILVTAYCFMTMNFEIESKKSKLYFADLLEGEEASGKGQVQPAE